MKKALMMASVASMIDLFNMDNIKILKDMGFEVHVACNFEFGSITSQERVNEFRKELESSGIKTFHIPVPRSIYAIKDIVKSYKLMKSLCEENNYDLVHCHSPIGGVVARLACKRARNQGTKVIYTAHGFHFFKGSSIKNWLIFYPIEKFCAKYTDCLITINKEDYEVAKKFNNTNVEYIPGIGMHIDDIKNMKVDRKAKRTQLGLNNDDFVLISVGQVSKRKNQEVIIKALANISDKHVKYLICGFGELEEYLRNLTLHLNLEDKVIFAGYRRDVKELLYAADCFVFPSLQEGLPVALMEAMATGLPVICSDIRGNVDLITNGKGGYLVDCHDVDGFAKYIDKLIRNINLKENMSEYNKKSIMEFDINKVKTHMEKIYLGV
ncbi:glycosyltransferase family 4 protein [Clostridium perfringens]|nr:glycosyltransferase family 4 protein [Clostridium perfringens]